MLCSRVHHDLAASCFQFLRSGTIAGLRLGGGRRRWIGAVKGRGYTRRDGDLDVRYSGPETRNYEEYL